MQLIWTELASNDLDTIEEYLLKEHGELVALDKIFNIIETVESLLPEHPGAGRYGRRKGTYELVVDGGPNIVVYRRNDVKAAIEILRVLHETQSWPSAND